MKLRNKQVANLSVYSIKNRKSYMTVPGQSVLELDDKVWIEEFEQEAKVQIEAGHLEIVVAPKKTEAQIAKEEADALKAAKALIAKAEAKKPSLLKDK